MFYEDLKLFRRRFPHLVATQDDSTVFKLVKERTPLNNRHDQNASSNVARVKSTNPPQSLVLGSRDEIDYAMGEVRE